MIDAISITRRGTELARQLRRDLPGLQVIVPRRFSLPGEQPYDGSVRAVVASSFANRRSLVLIMATGIAVRLIAPLLGEKQSDPAVVVVDDAGRFAISLVGGHVGGANALAEAVARAINAVAVITTASDSAGLISPDMLGRDHGWRIEPGSDLTALAAAIVNGERVGAVQECGALKVLAWAPPSVQTYPTIDQLIAGAPAAALIVTDRQPLPALTGIPVVVYRPPLLVLGAGSSKGAPAQELIDLAAQMLDRSGYSQRAVATVATIDLKRDEPAVVALAAYLQVPITTYTARELDAAPGDWERSPIVQRAVGTGGVCEPAALLAARTANLVVRKQKSAHATVALARSAEEIR